MSSLDQGLFALKNHKDNKSAIKSEISNLDFYATYCSGWIGSDYLYESPEVFIEFDTSIGNMVGNFKLNMFSEGNFDTIIRELLVRNDKIDIQNLHNSDIYLCLNDDLSKGYITFDDCVGFDDFNKKPVSFMDKDRYAPRQKVTEYSQTEPRSVNWFNNQVEFSYESHNSTTGWVERKIKSVDMNDENISIVVPIYEGWDTQWVFENTPQGIDKFYKFIDYLGLPKSISQIEDSIIYIHLIRNLSYENRQEILHYADTVERFIISGEPIQEDTKTFIQKIKDKLKFNFHSNDIDVDVNPSKRYRKAKSSLYYDLKDDCMSSLETESQYN